MPAARQAVTVRLEPVVEARLRDAATRLEIGKEPAEFLAQVVGEIGHVSGDDSAEQHPAETRRRVDRQQAATQRDTSCRGNGAAVPDLELGEEHPATVLTPRVGSNGAMPDRPAITLEGVRKQFGSVTALDGIDLAVPAGTVFGLLGPNGAGKTTAVRVLTTIIPPDTGRASVLGHDVVREADAVRASIGLAGQFAAVDENLTGSENLRLVGKLTHLPPNDVRARAESLLETFDGRRLDARGCSLC